MRRRHGTQCRMSSKAAKSMFGGLLVLTGVGTAQAEGPAVTFTTAAYESVANQKAVVLISVNVNRRWRCGQFENAQLQALGFDRAGAEKAASDKADLVIEDGALPARKGFVDLALIVDPGEYLLSSYRIKAARSVSEVGYFAGERATLVADGKSKAGTFSARAGEVVYVGHFSLDCAEAPIPWRYYLADKDDYAKYLKMVAREYPGFPTEQAKFRLFETTTMGNPYQPSE